MSGRRAARDTPRRRRWPAALALIAGAIATLVLVWNWSWFLPLAEWQASAILGRRVTMSHCTVTLAARPTLECDDVAVANPPGFAAGSSLLTMRNLRLRFDARALLHHVLELHAVAVEAPRVDLRVNAAGESNWKLPRLARRARTWHLSIDSLQVTDGIAHFTNTARHTDIELRFRSDTPAAANHSAQLDVAAHGTFRTQPVDAHFSGAPILAMRDAARPYPFDFDATSGTTRVRINGTLLTPLQPRGAQLRISLAGKSLAALYPFTSVPLPATPAFQFTGRLAYADQRLHLDDFSGRVGDSDLAGDVVVKLGGKRPLITADITSRHTRLPDWAGLVGAAAPTGQTPGARLLPQGSIDLPRLRAVDFDIRYASAAVDGLPWPAARLDLHLTSVNGRVRIDPLAIGIGGGKIAAHAVIYANGSPVRTQADVDVRDIKFTTTAHGRHATGTLGGRMAINTTGDSIAAMFANANGGLKMFMSRGDLQTALQTLGGREFATQLATLLGLPPHTPVRCMVGDLAFDTGHLTINTLLAATPHAAITGSGNANFRDETLDYRLDVEARHLRLDALHAPVFIKGTFRRPQLTQGDVPLGKTVTALALAPLQALLPGIGTRDGNEQECAALLGEAEKARKTGPNAVINPLPSQPAGSDGGAVPRR